MAKAGGRAHWQDFQSFRRKQATIGSLKFSRSACKDNNFKATWFNRLGLYIIFTDSLVPKERTILCYGANLFDII